MNKFLCGFTKVTGWLPFIIGNRPKVYYENKKLQSRKIKGKAIVMPNHCSVWDVASMMYLFPGRNLRCVVAELMFEKSKIFTWFLKGLGSIPVNRNTADFTFLNKSCEILDKNGVIEIYPEARIPLKGEERPLPFKTSIVYMALKSGAPIIPVVTNGEYCKKKRLRILIGTPINLLSLYDNKLPEKENIEIMTNMLRDKIKELSDELEKRSAKKQKSKKI